MKAGAGFFLANYKDWERYQNQEWDREASPSDAQIVEEELALAANVEPLGFDSMWTVEHHFTPYALSPNPLQYLSYWAGRAPGLDFGTMVVVLPWNAPLRVAEQIALLDNLTPGRSLQIGIGRGSANVEFDGWGVPKGEASGRFMESLEVIRKALGSPRFSHQGEFFSYPEITLRPSPRTPTLGDELAIAWSSPATLEIGANQGLRPMIIPQQSWEAHGADVDEYNWIRQQRGWDPVQPSVHSVVFCSEDEEEIAKARELYLPQYGDAVLRHYRFDDAAQYQAKGYEYYGQHSDEFSKMVATLGEDYGVWGTPEQCVETIDNIIAATGASDFVGIFRYGEMPLDMAEKSMKLFAEKVLPVVHSRETSARPAAARA